MQTINVRFRCPSCQSLHAGTCYGVTTNHVCPRCYAEQLQGLLGALRGPPA